MSQIQSLIYVSSAVPPVTRDRLLYLLERARKRNIEHQVTGVLLFDEGNFMQYIEGPSNGLKVVYEHIKRDPLHTGIIELSRDTVAERVFDQWAMGFRAFNGIEISDDWLRDELLEEKITQKIGDTSTVAILLQGVWYRATGLRG